MDRGGGGRRTSNFLRIRGMINNFRIGFINDFQINDFVHCVSMGDDSRHLVYFIQA